MHTKEDGSFSISPDAHQAVIDFIDSHGQYPPSPKETTTVKNQAFKVIGDNLIAYQPVILIRKSLSCKPNDYDQVVKDLQEAGVKAILVPSGASITDTQIFTGEGNWHNLHEVAADATKEKLDKAIKLMEEYTKTLKDLTNKPVTNKPKLPPDPPPQPVQDRRHCSNRYALGQTVKYVGGDYALFNHLCVVTALSYCEDDRKWVYAIDFGNCGLFTVDEDFLCVFESKWTKTRTKEEIEESQQHAISP